MDTVDNPLHLHEELDTLVSNDDGMRSAPLPLEVRQNAGPFILGEVLYPFQHFLPLNSDLYSVAVTA